MRAAKTTIPQNTDNPDFDFQEHMDQLEITVRTRALSGGSIHAQLEDLENIKTSATKTINNEARKMKTSVKRKLDRINEKMNEPKEVRIANQLKKQEPKKDAIIATIRKKTLDKIPALKKKKDKLEAEIDRNSIEIDFIIARDYKGIWPKRNKLFDYPLIYAALLVGFGILDWNFSRSALSAYGGFDRATASIVALAMGIALCICTHFFGEALQKKNKVRKLAFGITGAILCIFIIVLRIKF